MKTHTYMDDNGRIRTDADEETIENFRAVFGGIPRMVDRALDRAISREIWRESKLAWIYWQVWWRWKWK